MLVITLPDGAQRSFDAPVTALEVAQSIGAGLARSALAARIDDLAAFAVGAARKVAAALGRPADHAAREPERAAVAALAPLVDRDRRQRLLDRPDAVAPSRTVRVVGGA